MTEPKRACFDDCRKLKTQLGSQCLQSLTKTILQPRIQDVDARLELYELNVAMENQCCACGLPVRKQNSIDYDSGVVFCQNDYDNSESSSSSSSSSEGVMCERVIKCAWEHCKGVDHRCHICSRYACSNQYDRGSDYCAECLQSTCRHCFSVCSHKNCRRQKCIDCSPVEWGKKFCNSHKK